MKPIIIIGKSNSGKTTLLPVLSKKLNANPITTYTTRPRRPGEAKNTYHFISPFLFKLLIIFRFFAEYTSYNASFGKVFYGSSKRSFKNNSIIILNPYGVKAIKSKINCYVVYLNISNDLAEKRALLRGDNPIEIKRRLQQDNKDFDKIENFCDIIYTVDENSTVDEVSDRILKELKDLENRRMEIYERFC